VLSSIKISTEKKLCEVSVEWLYLQRLPTATSRVCVMEVFQLLKRVCFFLTQGRDVHESIRQTCIDISK
jgi:hypothetical protein